VPITLAIISYEVRQNSFTPGAFIGAMNMIARSGSFTGIAAFWPRKL
jgi:hypothetical protein